MKIDDIKFLGGVTIAIIGGVVLNLGSLIQKKAVNQLVYTKKRRLLMTLNDDTIDRDKLTHVQISVKDLVLSKLWMVGFILQALVGAGLFIIAQGMIGPSLTPALGSIGLVVLVFASCIVDEKLTWDEYIGLAVMMGAVFLLAFSKMVINVGDTDFLRVPFMVRVAVYTGAVIILCVFCKVWSWRRDRFEGPALAVLAGLLVALQNYWIGPFTALAGGIFHRKGNVTFDHHSVGIVLAYFFVSLFFVIVANLQTVYERQLAFRVGGAATMIPISHLPSHLSSPIIFSYVFKLSAPHKYSIPCMWAGLVLLLICSIIFGKRGAHFEQPEVDDEDKNEVSTKLISASS
eukprot:Phypoly_transcript_10578.p1 GENE.Phypoly_transcript_10578~~Phypoly_transcript_10578.p1  ORF type:complete len:346 (+),score=40.30 Phypoly_transcript_10578:147-1184(+)